MQVAESLAKYFHEEQNKNAAFINYGRVSYGIPSDEIESKFGWSSEEAVTSMFGELNSFLHKFGAEIKVHNGVAKEEKPVAIEVSIFK
jgi:hypothetical protein